MTVPVLVYTDAPDHNTGLGRICRELVMRIHNDFSDLFRVGTLGVFGRGSARFPWTQFHANGPDDALFNLRQITEDFFGQDRGVLLSITPPSWLFALSLPQFMVKEKPEWKAYTEWMGTRQFDIWSYLAIESHGPFNQYGPTTRAILGGVDRRLYYSKWGSTIAVNSGMTEADGVHRFLGHGIDCNVWKPADPSVVRHLRSELGVGPNDLMLGCVATNTRRKLLPLLFESAMILRHSLGSSRLKLWLNSDAPIREYNIGELADCFGFRLGSDLILTNTNEKRPDDWLAAMYSACDLTTLPTAGEGFGYPVVESLSCGTPVITGAFGAQSEFLDGFRPAWIVQPIASHVITNSTLMEPIYDAKQWASSLLMAWTELRQHGTLLREQCRERAITNWSWEVIWPIWKLWLAQGVAEMRQRQLDKETADAQQDGNSNETTPVDARCVAGAMGGDALEQGQRPDNGDAGRLDRGAPIGLDREADAARVGGTL
jgi:glycosyltransferase involved in cell wall biosynthesis